MDYFRQKLDLVANYFLQNVEKNKERKVSKYEIYFEQVFKVLNWEDNALTLGVFLVFNFLFWLVVYLELRFFGMVFLTSILVFLWDSYYEMKDLTNHQSIHGESYDEICFYIREIVFDLKLLRKESPSSFCIGMCLIFLFLSFIAKNLSGYLIMYLMMLAGFFVPLGYKFLSEDTKEWIKQMLRSFISVRGVLAEEELIPFISNKDFSNMETDFDSLLTDRTADSATNSLASGITAMPSYLDIADSQEGLKEEDLFPSRSLKEGVSFTPGQLSSDSDSEHRDMRFDSTHFNGDSSSEEEKFMGKGLRFTSEPTDAVPSTPNPETGLSGVLSNFATIGSSLVANVIKSTVPSAPLERKYSSSDSEFEIINSDDVQN